MFFTVNLNEFPEVGVVVLAVENRALLIPHPETRALQWVSADECSLSAVFMTPEQELWWRNLGSPPNQQEG